ncbi:MAG: hypothetical protein IKE53_01520 [Clostridiales bacterium]|nr:hypothetical protein [Clostridiales bacterium]
MDFSNIGQIVQTALDHMATHDIYKADLMSCDSTVLGRNTDERILKLIELDKHGEYLGRYWHTMSSSPDYKSNNKITFFIRKDGKPGGIWSSIMGMIDTYEVFDYYDGYYVGTRYMVMGRNVSPMFFAYYVTDGDRVKEIIELYVTGLPETARITRIALEYEGETAAAVSALHQSFRSSDGGYVLTNENDMLDSGSGVPDSSDRVIDDQEALCSELRKRTKKCETLEDYVNAFFEVIATAKENPEEEVSYTAGTNPIRFPGIGNECFFNLMRWTPQEDDEFYQLQMNISLDTGDGKIPYDNMMDDGGDLKEKVFLSESFKALKDKKILGVDIEVIET